MWTEAVESGEGLVKHFLVPRFNVSFRVEVFGRKHNILRVVSTPPIDSVPKSIVEGA